MKTLSNISILLVLVSGLTLIGCGESSSSNPSAPISSGGVNTPPVDNGSGDQPINNNPNNQNPNNPVHGPQCITGFCPPPQAPVRFVPSNGVDYAEFRINLGETVAIQFGQRVFQLTAVDIHKPGQIQCVTTPCNQPVGKIELHLLRPNGNQRVFKLKNNNNKSIKTFGRLEFKLIRLKRRKARLAVTLL